MERRAQESKLILPYPYLLALTVNKSPAVFIFYHARSTDFEEKIEGLWTGLSFLFFLVVNSYTFFNKEK